MRRRLGSTLLLTVAAAVASGCGEQQPLPSGPELHAIQSDSSGCDFTHINQLVNSYFTTPRQQVVRNIVSAMDAATDTSAIRNFGFDIMATMDTVVRLGIAGDPGVGANLVNHLILCMYQPGDAAFPATFPDTQNLRIALDPSLHGAFAVKPGSTSDVTDTTAVRSRPIDAPFSAVIPNGTWAQVVHNNAPPRVLIYGRPGLVVNHYDWKSLPHNAKLDSVVVAVCVDAGATLMLNEQNLGALPFVELAGSVFGVPGTSTCSAWSAALEGFGSSTFARGLAQTAKAIFGVHSLWATSLNPGGLGGSTGGLRSDFGPDQIGTVTVAFYRQPTGGVVNKPIPGPVEIQVYDSSDGTPVGGVQVTVLGVTNNGNKVVPKNNVDTTEIKTLSDGSVKALASFDSLTFNKSGGYALQIQPKPATQVLGRLSVSINIPVPLSNKFNMRPK